MFLQRILAIGLLISITACAQSHGPEMAGSKAYEKDGPEAYQMALEAWSREARTFDGLATALILKGTLQSPSFAKAYGNELARLRHLPSTARTDLIEAQVHAVNEGVHVLFSLQQPNHRQIHFDEKKDGVGWTLYLIDADGNSAAPLSIEEIDTSNELSPSLMFPYITRWDEVFVATFPATPEGSGQPFLGNGSSPLIFQVASEAGSAQLQWFATE